MPTRYYSSGQSLTPPSHHQALLRALADNLIPGLPPSVRILLVSQLDSENVVLEARRDGETASVLEAVLRSDAQRLRAERESEGEHVCSFRNFAW